MLMYDLKHQCVLFSHNGTRIFFRILFSHTDHNLLVKTIPLNMWQCDLKLNASHSVKLANFASPFKFHQVKFPQQVCLEKDRRCFHEVSIAFSFSLRKTHLSFSSQTSFMTGGIWKDWQNLKGLAELANLTVRLDKFA